MHVLFRWYVLVLGCFWSEASSEQARFQFRGYRCERCGIEL